MERTVLLVLSMRMTRRGRGGRRVMHIQKNGINSIVVELGRNLAIRLSGYLTLLIGVGSYKRGLPIIPRANQVVAGEIIPFSALRNDFHFQPLLCINTTNILNHATKSRNVAKGQTQEGNACCRVRQGVAAVRFV